MYFFPGITSFFFFLMWCSFSRTLFFSNRMWAPIVIFFSVGYCKLSPLTHWHQGLSGWAPYWGQGTWGPKLELLSTQFSLFTSLFPFTHIIFHSVALTVSDPHSQKNNEWKPALQIPELQQMLLSFLSLFWVLAASLQKKDTLLKLFQLTT